MKKPYENPAICVIPLKYQSCLLDTSLLDTMLSEDEEYIDWDNDGGQ
jgi:hypothetical protein